MTFRYQLAVVASPAGTALSVGGAGDKPSAAGVYIDPHLVVLLFLFGFCLLYAALLAIDILNGKQSVDSLVEE